MSNSPVELAPETRNTAPDILLTNYKMLDMLLLRREDVPLFEGAGEQHDVLRVQHALRGQRLSILARRRLFKHREVVGGDVRGVIE